MQPDFEAIVGRFHDISLAELAKRLGVTTPTIIAWVRRDSIPADRWDALIREAAKAGVKGVSVDSLMGALRVSQARKSRLHYAYNERRDSRSSRGQPHGQ